MSDGVFRGSLGIFNFYVRLNIYACGLACVRAQEPEEGLKRA